jgi:hypothetical protein
MNIIYEKKLYDTSERVSEQVIEQVGLQSSWIVTSIYDINIIYEKKLYDTSERVSEQVSEQAGGQS